MTTPASTPADPTTPSDPRTAHPAAADLADTDLPYPGRTQDMISRPDHGEDSYVGHGRLTGRRVLVTGGDSGIGRAVVIAMAREGADVTIAHLPEELADAQESARWVEQAGRTAHLVAGDLREESFCRELVATAVERMGGLDVLVSNAAYQMAQPDGLEAISTEQLDRTLKTNVYALVWLAQAALPHLRPGASIICTSSVQAFSPSPGLLDYAMTKAAILNLVRGLSQAVADRGIRVNAVCPGPIWTPLIPATMDAEKAEDFGSDTPLGRPGQPAELAGAYVYLASDEASYVTGERIVATGGRLV